ncbi:hypothetical protein MRB53_010295 [Persea americana]|uniref:Uncharacterized protein n=1 Tax=Persea americana TaxID=3435 RepID=A0ACC2LS82_PERAE|nr:hypothetical protein MRB53_010295 [Persea americana]
MSRRGREVRDKGTEREERGNGAQWVLSAGRGKELTWWRRRRRRDLQGTAVAARWVQVNLLLHVEKGDGGAACVRPGEARA